MDQIQMDQNPPPRIERWALRLQGYSFKLVYQPGSGNIADYLSRSPVSKPLSRNLAEEYVCHLTANLLPVATSESEAGV